MVRVSEGFRYQEATVMIQESKMFTNKSIPPSILGTEL